MKPMRCIYFSLLALFISNFFKADTGWTATFNHPVSFCENKGQFRSPDKQNAKFAYDDGAYRILFTDKGLVYSFAVTEDSDKSPDYNYPEKEIENKNKKITRDYITMTWKNISPNCRLKAFDESTEYYSYIFEKNGQEQNINHVKGFKKIVYENLYDGIDAIYTIHPSGGVKYSFVVHKNAITSGIRMEYSKNVSISNNTLYIPSLFGNITDSDLKCFNAADSSEVISSSFKQINSNTIGFQIGNYSNGKTIIIDPWSQSPVLNNTKKIWEVETDNSGNVYIYGGDMPVRILKYNSAGTLQWNFASAIDTANFWLGGMVTNQTTGETYITSGSVGRIWKISTAGAVVWTNNPNGFNSFEYWSLSFNCNGTKLAIGGSSGTFSIRGYLFNINLGTGAQSGSRLIGYGGMGFPPTLQEASSICWSPYNSYFFLTLDTVGSLNDAMTTMNFKTSTGYLFDYYIPNFGLGTKQPISATRANTVALYTMNGTSVHKRNLTSGAVLATAAIPGGSSATGFLGGRKLPNNAGIDLDDCGNVYVGSSNQLVKYDGNLNLLSSSATTFPIYDVDVNSNGEVAVCGFAGGTGYVRAIGMSACAQVTPVCLSILPVELSSFDVKCEGSKAEINWETSSEKNNNYFSVQRSEDGINFSEIKKVKGAINSNNKIKYSVNDDKPLRGTSYYRIVQIDVGGKENIHDAVSFNDDCSHTAGGIAVFPNPFNDKFEADVILYENAFVSVELFNNQGVLLKNILNNSELTLGLNTIGVETDELPSGMYLLKITVNGNPSYRKIIKGD